MRLNQFLARAGFGSRRACEELIRTGAVTINGHRLRELATQVAPEDQVLVHGKPVKKPVTLVAMLHKPAGYLCTSTASTRAQTIFDLLPPNWPRVVYVGRLDKESEGLLLMTNDGDLAQRLTHPSYKLPKTYIVTLDREFDFALAPKLRKGFPIEGGLARMDEIFRVGPRTLKVVLTQGLKRQIREMYYRVGYEVRRLVRVQIGSLTLEGLPAGQHLVLTQAEVRRHFSERTPTALPSATAKRPLTAAERKPSAPTRPAPVDPARAKPIAKLASGSKP